MPDATAEWFLRVEERQLGPLTIEQLRNLANDGDIARHTLLRRGEGGETLAADAVAGLADLFPAPATPLVPEHRARLFVDPTRLGRRLIGLWTLCALASAIAMVADVHLAVVIADIEQGVAYDEAQVATAKFFLGWARFAQAFVWLIGSITLLAWMYRTYANLRALVVAGPAHAPAWAVVAWFVPLLHLYHPYRVLAETWVESSRAASKTGEHAPVAILRWWWGLLLLPTAGVVVLILMHAAESTRLYANLAADAVRVSSAVVAAVIVQHISNWQEDASPRAHSQPGG